MKLGLFWDCSIGIKSYYVKDGTAYDFEKNQPYMYHHGITSQCFMSTHNYPFLWGDGVFLNLVDWGENLPDLDLDIIFYANERIGLDDETKHLYTIERLNKKYPRAKIVVYFKEVKVQPHREKNRIKFLKTADYLNVEGVTSLKSLPEYLEYEKILNKKINFTSQPMNIEYIHNNLYSNEKTLSIYAYIPQSQYRHGRTYKFAEYIGNKYNIPVIYKTQEDTKSMDQPTFMKHWSKHLFHFNLDPSYLHPGGQCCQVACMGSINIGGNNESHDILFPSTSGIDENKLEKAFVELLNNREKQIETIQYAWEKLNEVYSFNSIRKQIKELYG